MINQIKEAYRILRMSHYQKKRHLVSILKQRRECQKRILEIEKQIKENEIKTINHILNKI